MGPWNSPGGLPQLGLCIPGSRLEDLEYQARPAHQGMSTEIASATSSLHGSSPPPHLPPQVFRQQEGSEFVRILDDIRYGRNVLQALTRLRDLCMRPLPSTDGIKPTQLFSRNKEVDGTNELELSKLPGNLMVFKAADEVRGQPTTLQQNR